METGFHLHFYYFCNTNRLQLQTLINWNVPTENSPPKHQANLTTETGFHLHFYFLYNTQQTSASNTEQLKCPYSDKFWHKNQVQLNKKTKQKNFHLQFYFLYNTQQTSASNTEQLLQTLSNWNGPKEKFPPKNQAELNTETGFHLQFYFLYNRQQTSTSNTQQLKCPHKWQISTSKSSRWKVWKWPC